jgi:hypothetical protein
LHGFAERGIPFVVAQEHVSGDLDLVMPALRACDHRPARPPFKFYVVRNPRPSTESAELAPTLEFRCFKCRHHWRVGRADFASNTRPAAERA